MSIKPVFREDIESFTVSTYPIRTFSSSSLGVTGSVNLFARRSKIEKEVSPLGSFVESKYSDSDISSYLSFVNERSKKLTYVINDPNSTSGEKTAAASEYSSLVLSYLQKVNEQTQSAKKTKKFNIIRFTPSAFFSENTSRKLIVKDILGKYYKSYYNSVDWAYTNYNCLSFFESDSFSNESALLFPNIDGPESQLHEGYESATYNLSSSFSFDFYINPRFKQKNPDEDFKDGTIFHLSSSYCVSLVSGSKKDENGKTSSFRIKLQLSHSADIPPSEALPGNFPNNLVFMSDDNSLDWNTWNHVVIRWGTNLINDGTGSFNINGSDKGFFVVPSGTIALQSMDLSSLSSPDVLCIGNYWEGTNEGLSSQSYFFSADPAERDGLEVLDETTSVNEPLNYFFRHSLNAEVHDLSIKRYYMTDEDILASSSLGPENISSERFAFYLPPFFTEESPYRKNVNGTGGVLQTPFFEINGKTNDPFNAAMSFGVNGHYINLENFTRDFANNTYPRLHKLTGSAIPNTTEAKPANDFLYEDPYVVNRNLLIMPCDDGGFFPNFSIIENEFSQSRIIPDNDYSKISLENMLSTSSLLFGTVFENVEGVDSVSAQYFAEDLIGPTPEKPGLEPGTATINAKNQYESLSISDPGVQPLSPLVIYERTRDQSSNQVTFFDISNLYYGKNIKPGTFSISDSSLTGSQGRLRITLKDDGKGNLYREDSLSDGPRWSSCGNIYYNEGIVVIKSPHLYFFGKDQYEVSFNGEQNVHSLKLEVLADAGLFNSSSNPSYKDVPASGIETDNNPEFVYISGINFHDENLNIVAKSQLAQPIVKRTNSQILFKVGLDF